MTRTSDSLKLVGHGPFMIQGGRINDVPRRDFFEANGHDCVSAASITFFTKEKLYL